MKQKQEFKKADFVTMRHSDPNIIGIIQEKTDSGKYAVDFKLHSNYDDKDKVQSLVLSDDEIKPARINFSKLHHI